MQEEQKNKKVAILFKGKLENGEVFEETPDDHPLVFSLGMNIFFPEIEKEISKMKPGETRSIELTPEQAYGPYYDNLIQTIDRSVLEDRTDPKPGMVLSFTLEGKNGPEKVPATVISASENEISVDYNHPLAGKSVIYDVTLHSFIK